MKTYGISHQDADEGALATHVERIRTLGFSVLPSAMDGEEVLALGRCLESVMARQVEEFGGSSRLEAIGDTLTARSPLVYDAAFVRLAARSELLDLVRVLLGDYVVLMQQNGIINPPSGPHTQAAYHRDLPYQHFTSSRPLAISALFCIDHFRPESGGTLVIPGSQHVEGFPSQSVASTLEVSVEAQPGSFIVFDSMVFHRAGTNASGAPRRAVNHVYSLPIIAQQISLPDALAGRYADDPVLARLFGYESRPGRSVDDWRTRRLERVKGQAAV